MAQHVTQERNNTTYILLALMKNIKSRVKKLYSTESSDEPSLTIKARLSVYNVGEKKGIYCEGTNTNEPIEWFSPLGDKVEGRSTKNNRVYVERRMNEPHMVALIIHSTKIQDSGNWTCSSGDLSKTIEIVVGEKVFMPVTQERLVADEGKSVKLNCEARGIPPPVVQWYIDGGVIEENPAKYVMRKKEDNYTLEIKNLTHADAGDYSCKVTQKALSHYTSKNIKLTVHHKPILFDPETGEVYPSESQASKFRVEEVFAVLNDTKYITCNAIAVPLPSFRWYRRINNFDKQITEEDLIKPGETGVSSTLILRMQDESDEGQYKCTASNSKGHMSVIFHVKSGQKPNAPDYIAATSANSTHLIFNVTCSNCTIMPKGEYAPEDANNLPVDGFSFETTVHKENYPPDWDEAEEIAVDIVDATDTLFPVGPLPNTTTYHVRVRARNAAGFSDWLEMDGTVSTTDHAIRLVATIGLVVCACVFSLYY